MERILIEKNKGFTLLELLIVIAIIAILVTIVLLAMDPAQRMRSAQDRRAASNVRAAGTLLSVCVNGELSQVPPNFIEPCGDPVDSSVRDQYGNTPATSVVAMGDDGDDDEVCVAEQGSTGGINGHYYVYSILTGEVEENTGTMPASDHPINGWCLGAP